MVSWSQHQADAHEARIGTKHTQPAGELANDERKLHDQIEQELRRRRFYFVHSRMDRKSTNALGTPDFIVAMPAGRTLWIECKRKGGKLTQEQNIARHILTALEHQHAVVYSFEEFLKLINAPIKSEE